MSIYIITANENIVIKTMVVLPFTAATNPCIRATSQNLLVTMVVTMLIMAVATAIFIMTMAAIVILVITNYITEVNSVTHR